MPGLKGKIKGVRKLARKLSGKKKKKKGGEDAKSKEQERKDRNKQNAIRFKSDEALSKLSKVCKAAFEGDVAKLESQLKKGAAVDEKDAYGRTALHYAAWAGHSDAVHLLISEYGAKATADNDGASPVTKAIEANYYDVVSTLIEDQQAGNLEAFDHDGASLLMIAAKRGDAELAEVLLREGQVDPDTLNPSRPVRGGQSALHIAADAGNTNVIEVLIEQQADVDLRDSDQKTPLMTAAAKAHTQAVTLLLEEGADASLKCNTGGWRASDYARMQGEDKLANAIDEHQSEMAEHDDGNDDDADADSAVEDANISGNVTPLQPQSSSGGNTTNIETTRSESVLSEGMSEVMGNQSGEANDSNSRDGEQMNTSGYRDGSVLSEVSEGMSEVMGNQPGNANGGIDRNDRNDVDHGRQQASMYGNQSNFSEPRSDDQASEFSLSDAEGSEDDEREDSTTQLVNLRDIAGVPSWQGPRGEGRSESVLSEGMSEVMGPRTPHTQSGQSGSGSQEKSTGGSSDVSSGMHEVQKTEVDRNARPEAPANLSSQSGMTSDDADQSGSLIDELGTQNNTSHLGDSASRARPDAPANLDSMTSDDGDQTGSLIDELDGQNLSGPADDADRMRPNAPANLSSQSNQSALSSSEGDHTGSIVEDDEQETQKDAAALMREKQAKLFGYRRDEAAVTQGNLDFVDEDSGSDADPTDDQNQESGSATTPQVSTQPPPSTSSSGNPPIAAPTDNLSDDSDWDSPEPGGKPDGDDTEPAQPAPNVPGQGADDHPTGQPEGGAVSGTHDDGGVDAAQGTSGAMPGNTVQPPASKRLSAAEEAKRKRLAAKEHKEKGSTSTTATTALANPVVKEPVQPQSNAGASGEETDYDLRKAEAAKKEQERIRQLEIEMRKKMMGTNEPAPDPAPSTAPADDAADTSGNQTPGPSSVSPSRYDDNDDSSSFMDSTLMQLVHGLPVRTITLQRNAGPLGFQLVQAPEGTVGVRLNQIIAMSQAENAGCQLNDIIVAVGETAVLRHENSDRHVNVVRDAIKECGDVVQLHVVNGSDFDRLESKSSGSDALSFSQLQSENDDTSNITKDDVDQQIRDSQAARELAERALLGQKSADDEAANKAKMDALESKHAAEARRAQLALEEAAQLRQQVLDAEEQKNRAAAEAKQQLLQQQQADALRLQEADAAAAKLKEEVARERAAAARAAEEAAKKQATDIEAQALARIRAAEAEAAKIKQQMAREKEQQQKEQAALAASLEQQKQAALLASRQQAGTEMEESLRQAEEVAEKAKQAAAQEVHESKMLLLNEQKEHQDKLIEMQQKIRKLESDARQKVQETQREMAMSKLQSDIQLREREEALARDKVRLEQQLKNASFSQAQEMELLETKAKVKQLEHDNKELSVANASLIGGQRNDSQNLFASHSINASFSGPRGAGNEDLEDAQEQTRVLSNQIVQMSERLAKEEQSSRELKMKCGDKDMQLRVKESQLSDLKTRRAMIDAENTELLEQQTKDHAALEASASAAAKLTAERSRLRTELDESKAQADELHQQVALKDQLLRQHTQLSERKGAEARAAATELQDALIKIHALENNKRELLELNSTLSVESKTAHEHMQKQIEQYALTHKSMVAKLEKATSELTARDSGLKSSDEKYFELDMQLTAAKTQVEAVNSAHQYEITRCQKLLQENTDLKQKLKKNRGSESQTAIAVAELDTAKASLAAANKQVQDLTSQLSLARNGHAAAEGERTSSTERIAALESSTSSQTREIDVLIKKLEAKDTELVHEREKQAMALNGAKREHATLHEKVVSEMSSLREAYEKLKSEFRKMQTAKEKVDVMLESQHEVHNQTLLKVADLEAQVRSEKSRHQTMASDADTKNSEMKEFKEQCIRLEGEVGGLKSANEQMNVLTTSQHEELLTLRGTIDEHKEEIKLLRSNKQELERIILASDANAKELKGALLQEEARKNTLEHGIEGLIEQKDVRGQLLTDAQARCAELDRLAKEHDEQRRAAEVKARELEQLWQNEVVSRNKAGAKILKIEQAAAQWEDRLAKEKARTAEAVRRKQELELRMESMHQRVNRLEGKTATSTERLAAAERELVEYKTGQRRSPAIQALISQEQRSLESKIRVQQSELSAAREQLRVANTAASDTAVKLANGEYFSRDQMELYKREIDLKAKQKISAARDELNDLLLRSKLEHEAQLVGISREAALAKTHAAETRIKQIEHETQVFRSSLTTDTADLGAMASRARSALAPLNRTSSTNWTDLQAARAAYQSKKSAAASKREQTANMLSNWSTPTNRFK